MQKLDQMQILEGLTAQVQQLKPSLLSGSLSVKAANGLSWTLYLRWGRLSWQAGGAHPDERWRRHLALFCPKVTNIDLEQLNFQPGPHWEYSVLARLQERGLIQRQQLHDLVASAVTEVLFDAIQYCQSGGDELSYSTTPNDMPSLLLVLVEPEQALKQAIQAWQEWQNAGLAAYSPNLFPVIQQPALLQKQASASTYQWMISQVDGTQTLRSLAVKSKQNVVTLTQSLMSLVTVGTIAFLKSPTKKGELPATVNEKQSNSASSNGNNLGVAPPEAQPLLADAFKPLVACVDDSAVVLQALEEILAQQGCRFLGIQDSLKAIPLLLKSKPKLIFLDLLMPVTNGYEVCAQLRKTPSLKDVPIVILTGRDGLVDRMRAKIAGSTDFLTKPVEAEPVLNMLYKHLKIGDKRE